MHHCRFQKKQKYKILASFFRTCYTHFVIYYKDKFSFRKSKNLEFM